MVTAATVAVEDEEERRVRLLLLGKAAVLAHQYERPLAAEMDEYEQPARDAGRDARCSFDKRASSPAGSSRPLREEMRASVCNRNTCPLRRGCGRPRAASASWDWTVHHLLLRSATALKAGEVGVGVVKDDVDLKVPVERVALEGSRGPR